MIDVHCHMLPFVDDGARDWETSLTMARMAYEDGIRTTILTPHWTGQPGEIDSVKARRTELAERLRDAGIGLNLLLGNEVILTPQLEEALQDGGALHLADSKFVLLETAQLEHGAFNRKAIFRLQTHGHRVILAHPERVPSWEKEHTELKELIQAGCALQVNAQSLLGGFGKGPKLAAERFLKAGWVSLMGTDAHSTGSRPPILSAALARVEKLIGEAGARRLVLDNPQRILENRPLPWVDLDAEPVKRGFSFPWSRG